MKCIISRVSSMPSLMRYSFCTVLQWQVKCMFKFHNFHCYSIACSCHASLRHHHRVLVIRAKCILRSTLVKQSSITLLKLSASAFKISYSPMNSSRTTKYMSKTWPGINVYCFFPESVNSSTILSKELDCTSIPNNVPPYYECDNQQHSTVNAMQETFVSVARGM